MTGRHRAVGDGSWAGMNLRSRLILAGYVAAWLAMFIVGIIHLAGGGHL